jgi:hypothetical protein
MIFSLLKHVIVYGDIDCSNFKARTMRDGDKTYGFNSEYEKVLGEIYNKNVAIWDEMSLKTVDGKITSIVVNVKSLNANDKSEIRSEILNQLKTLFDDLNICRKFICTFCVKNVNTRSGNFSIGNSNYFSNITDLRRFLVPYIPNEHLLQKQFKDVGSEENPSEASGKQYYVCFEEIGVDKEHAIDKSKVTIDETLIVLRYIYVLHEWFETECPSLGVALDYSSYRSCIIDTGRSVLTDSNEMGTQVFTLSQSDFERLPGVKKMCEILKKRRNERSDIENVIVRSMRWVSVAASADSVFVRYVCLVTCLETLLIKTSETKNKTSNITNRLLKICSKDINKIDEKMKVKVCEIYYNRSRCLHAGWTNVSSGDLSLLIYMVGFVYKYLMHPNVLDKCTTIDGVIDLIDVSEC